jgi:16S rRNA processing protein RimM
LISIGKILRSQGNRGELKLKFYDNSLVDLAAHDALFIGKEGELREFKLEFFTPGGKYFYIKLAGVDSLSQADSLAGLEVFVPQESLKLCAIGQYYIFELKGCSVLSLKGEVIGRVVDVLSVPANDLLVIDKEGKEILVPFHESICRQVDLVKKEIRIDAPAGLLEINET